jgi:hypothetical protein
MRSADDLDIMFDECIERLAQGESLESCLQQHRAQADELRELLTTTQTLSSMAVAPPPPSTLMSLGKQRFLRAAAQGTAPSAVTPATLPQATPSTGLFAWLRSPGPIGRPAIVGVTLLTVLALFAAITALSISALPGDLFYPPKVAAETIDMNVRKVLNPEQAAELQEAFDRNRAADVQKAMDLGRQASVTLNGYVIYADEQSLTLNTEIRVALRSDLLAGLRNDLRQGTYLTVVGHIEPDSRVVQADQVIVFVPIAGNNMKGTTRLTATFTATRRPTRRPLVVPPTRRPIARPTRRPQPTATRVPLPAVTATWTSTPTSDVTATPSTTAVVVTPSATATTGEVTPTATAADLTPTPDELTPTASPTPDEPTPTPTVTDVAASTPTPTDEPPTATPEPPTATPEPPTATPEPPTATPEPPPTGGPASWIETAWSTKSGPGTYPRSTRPATVCGFCKRFRL